MEVNRGVANTIDRTDVLVVGAGLAGLRVATLLARLGHDVILADRRRSLATSVRTTGIFVRRTLEDFPLPEAHLGPPIRHVKLYPPDSDRPVTLVSERDEFRVGDMAALYEFGAEESITAGVRLLLGTRYQGRLAQGHLLSGPGGDRMVVARFVVGADGAQSAVASALGLHRNRRILVGAEEVYPTTSGIGTPTFHCILDPQRAPGYLAWVVDDGRHAHVGVAGYPERFRGGLRRVAERFAVDGALLAGLERPASVERRAGVIPVGGLLRKIASTEGLLVGDAAGAVSPLTAGGLDPCLRLSDHAVEILDQALRAGSSDPLARYDGAALRARFRGRLLLRRGLSMVRTRSLARAAFAGLRTPPGRAAASRIIFGDRSFPLPAPAPVPS